jgi:hypothetical protein
MLLEAASADPENHDLGSDFRLASAAPSSVRRRWRQRSRRWRRARRLLIARPDQPGTYGGVAPDAEGDDGDGGVAIDDDGR